MRSGPGSIGQHARGMVQSGDVVTGVFAAIGWTWGGDWSDDKDQGHFSLTGH
jgi:hypothetical protein